MRQQADSKAAFLTPRTTVALAAILALAAVLRAVLVVHAPAFIVGSDSGQFYAAGYHLADGGDLDLPLKRAPLYPTFLAGVIVVLGPSLEAAALVQHALGLATLVLTYVIGAVAFGRGTGLIAALGTALNGSLLLMERTIMSEALFTPILLAGMLFSLVALRSGRPGLFLLAGLALGLATLTRPAAQAVLPLALVAVVLRPGVWRRRLAAAGLVCLGFLLVVGPWAVRNRAVHGVAAVGGGLGDSLFARVRLHDPTFEFRDRAAPRADGEQSRIRQRTFDLGREHRFGSDVQRALQAEFSLSEAQSDAALREAALQVVRQEPGRYLRGTLGFFVQLGLGFEKPQRQFWESRSDPWQSRAWPESVRYAAELPAPPSAASRSIVDTITGLYQDHKLGGLIPVLFLLGTVRCLTAGGGPGAALLPLVVVSQLLLYAALDGPISRYRYPQQPLIVLIAATGLIWVAVRIRARSWPGRAAQPRGSTEKVATRPGSGVRTTPARSP